MNISSMRICRRDRTQQVASCNAVHSLFIASLTVAIVWAQGQVATNVGEDAKKSNGAPGVPIHPDQKLELR